MLCVQVDDVGNCTEVPVRTTRSGTLQVNKKTVHIHFIAKEIGVAVASYNTIDSLQLPSTIPFEFQFPPPLNSYIYPRDVFVVAIDSNEENANEKIKIKTFSSKDLTDLCAELGHKALIKEDETAVYDVPAIPLQLDGDDVNDDQSEEDTEDIEEDEIDDDIEESDDDEWREQDEDDSSTT